MENFLAGLAFFQRIAPLAEGDNHHPDLHLEGYNSVRCVLWTHVRGGLTLNDLIVAAKIDTVAPESK